MTEDTADAGDGGTTIGVDVTKIGGGLEKADDTTQLNERRIATDIGRGIQPPYNPDRLAAFMELNETHSAAVRKKARYEVGHGFDITPHRSVDAEDASDEQFETIRDFWHGSESQWMVGPNGTAATTPEEVLEQARIDYHGIGYCAVEILTRADGTPTGLAHVPARTVRVRKAETDDGEVVKGHGYVQIRNGRTRYFGEAGDRYADDPKFVDKETGDVADDARELPNEPANELIWVQNPTPLALYYGVPDWVAATRTIAADEAAKDYNHQFFENDTIPRYAIKVTGGELKESSKQELRKLFKNLQDSPHRTVILEVEEFAKNLDSDIEIELVPLSASRTQDMDFENFRERNEHEIAKVHEVPPVLLNRTETSNRSNSKEQVQEFALSVIAPEQQKFAARLYQVLHQAAFGAPDWTIEFTLRGAEQPKDEADVARTRVMAARGTMTVDEARAEVGIGPLPDEHPVDGDTLLAELGADQSQEFNAVGERPEYLPPAENKLGERADVTLKESVETVSFDSTNLESAAYDADNDELYVRFKRDEGTDSLYVYLDVPQQIWEGLKDASSHGSYHYSNIRTEFPYEEITSHHDRLPGTEQPTELPTGL
ncbi:phage portal protein [Halobellus sp. H-GB7]|uniref:phage portal protein n=1 Tax=Halobellus sp. H-GB7 TaxID=3069756 RepID=UPI0027B4FCE1|nr:phage portal protein [Halobellus sp. H-GB7]MDQ2053243.1 phage portal protein [Halobellus sp. H-GB7]